jgi:hypothetical protein
MKTQPIKADFKTVFKATCAFYLAQLAMALIGLTIIGLVFMFIGYLNK